MLAGKTALAGIIVLYPRSDCLIVENAAVEPRFQGRGLGQRLLAFAEAEARRRGLVKLRLYTNVMMTENLPFYGRLGFVEVERLTEARYDRVYMEKRLAV